MNTADQEFMAKIGNGVDFISSEMIAKRISTKCPTGISRVDGKWMINSDVPSSTKGTIAACEIDLDLEHIDLDNYGESWTVTDAIIEGIECHEDRELERKILDEHAEEETAN